MLTAGVLARLTERDLFFVGASHGWTLEETRRLVFLAWLICTGRIDRWEGAGRWTVS